METVKLTSVNVFGGLILGYNTGIIADALTPLTDDFHLNAFSKGLVTSTILVGGMIGSFVGGPLADAVGRKKALFITGLITLVFSLGACFSPSWQVLAALRGILGLPIGMTCVVCPLYVGEVARPEQRGFLGTFFQLSITFGIVVAYGIGYLLLHVEHNWRIMIGLGAIPGALLMLIAVIWTTESEVWLNKRGGGYSEITPLASEYGGNSNNSRSSALFTRRNTKPLIVGVVMTIVLQLTGINTIIYYAPKIFTQAGASANTALLATIGVGAWNFVTTLVATFVVERAGRRALFLSSLGVCVLSTLILGINYQFAAHHQSVLTAVAILGVCLFLAGFEAGVGPLFYVILNEIFEVPDRGIAASVMNFLQWSWNLGISFAFLPLIDSIGLPYTYWIFTGIGLGGFIILFIMLPETTGGADFDTMWSSRSRRAVN